MTPEQSTMLKDIHDAIHGNGQPGIKTMVHENRQRLNIHGWIGGTMFGGVVVALIAIAIPKLFGT